VVEEFVYGKIYKNNRKEQFVRYKGSEFTGSSTIMLHFTILHPIPEANEYGYVARNFSMNLENSKEWFDETSKVVEILYGEDK